MTPRHDRLIDSFGRVHNNLRISVTDRCNIRCVYCMPENAEFMPRNQLLTFEEIERFVRIAVPLGIDKIRLTGGEPLVRRDLPGLVEKTRRDPGDQGHRPDDQRHPAGPAGASALGRRPEADQHQPGHDGPGSVPQLTRRPGLEQVIEGILAAKAAGFDPVKINAVAIRGVDRGGRRPAGPVRPRARAGDAVHRVHAARRRASWERDKVLFAAEILERLTARDRPARPAPDQDPRAPAIDYDYVDGGGRVGLIASVSRPFCMSCNRVRLTSDGKLRNCLFALDETDIRGLLRGGASRRGDRPGHPRVAWRRSGKATRSTRPGSSSPSG